MKRSMVSMTSNRILLGDGILLGEDISLGDNVLLGDGILLGGSTLFDDAPPQSYNTVIRGDAGLE